MMDEKLETLHQLGESLFEAREYTASALCFKEAAELFHAASQFGYARSLEWGLGVTANQNEAFVWYRRAAQLGNVLAMCRMGDAERDGELGTTNAAEAFAWYLKAAQLGYPPAMEYVAGCYFYGRGVELDMQEAARWYQKAAESGGELTPQELVSLEKVLSAAANDAAVASDKIAAHPADKR
jgi:TPR repeat protein